MPTNEFWSLADDVQLYLTKYAGALLGDNRGADEEEALKDTIKTYLRMRNLSQDDALIDKLFNELMGYSVLAQDLQNEQIDEININSWDDITVTFSDGHKEKREEHFRSPTHALDIFRRMLRHSGTILDNAMPLAQGHLPGNARLTVMKTPLVDEDVGVSASIRRLRHEQLSVDTLIHSGMLSREMFVFLQTALRYGVSVIIAGRTSSGKTTLLNLLSSTLPDDKRIYTIESGARELSLVRHDEKGNISNNVVHTLSRRSDKESYDISQETLVTAALRFDPDLIVIGEIRDAEAHGAVEASLTGHTVISTVHAGPGNGAHSRMALLCQRRFQLGMDVSLSQCREAFPLVVFAHMGEDHKRRVMQIAECVMDENKNPSYRTLFAYDFETDSFLSVEPPSPTLLSHMRLSGAPESFCQHCERKEKPS